MPGLVNNFSSETLALIASRLAGPPDVSLVDESDIKAGRVDFSEQRDLAQVYATLAVAQAVRELRDEIHSHRSEPL
ncbi:MAG TPA: hypothetical protein VMF65_17595 [Acidimicrobiales bacterium]|nr:hypothetical protein [Acidimicrobiales bacterium]